MSRYAKMFASLRARQEAAFGAFVMLGDPDPLTSASVLDALVVGGADMIEVGIPFSDPVADGPVIQAAADRALAGGTRTTDVLDVVQAAAGTGAPTVVMTYWNPVERHGVDRFAADLAAAGGAGLITPDLTPDEAGEWMAASDAHGLDRIFLVAPSSTDARLAMTAEASRGFVYATSVMGVTGPRAQTSTAAPELVRRIRAADREAMVGVGLGVSNGAQALEVSRFADAVVVGSLLVKALLDAEDAGTPADLTKLRRTVADLAAGIRSETPKSQELPAGRAG
jgi:tryptophan synthase alpha chain